MGVREHQGRGDMHRIETTLPQLLQEKAQHYQGRTAMREKYKGIWQEISWMDYLVNVRHLALGLAELGMQRGEHGAILGENCPEWIYADLAFQSLGCVSVGIYPTNSAEQVHYILDHSQATFVVVMDQEQADKVLEVRETLTGLKRIIVVDMKGLRHYREEVLIGFSQVQEIGQKSQALHPGRFEQYVGATHPDDVAFIVYTSGTTGHPKGAMISHRGHLHGIVHGMQPILHFTDKDTILSYLPLCHILERAVSVSMPLMFGYTINFAESIDTVTQNIYEISPTFFAAVPRILEKMHSGLFIKMGDTTPLKRCMFDFWAPVGRKVVRYRMNRERVPLPLLMAYGLAYLFVLRAVRDKLGMGRTRCLMSGGAPIAPEVLDFYRSLGVFTLEMYAMTECGCISGPHHRLKYGSVGEPCGALELKLAADGEICVRGDAVFCGFYRDEEASRAMVVDGWLHTGDVGQLDEDGHLYIVDRKKDIIITSGGKNISPSEIENKLKCSPYIKEAIVIGDGRKFLSALIQIDYENTGNWAQKNRIPYTTYKSLAENPQVFELIKEEVSRANEGFARVESVKKYIILDKELDQDDEELTATQKVKRRVIEKRFRTEIDAMYGSG